MFSGLAFKLFLGMAVLSAIGGGIAYIKILQLQLQVAEENQAKLEGVVQGQKDVFDKQTQDIKLMRDLNDKVQTQFQLAQQEKNDLQKRFNQSANGDPRDIGNLAIQKPTLVQSAINNTTKFALRCNEIVTGALVLEIDKNNNVCPDLVKVRVP